MLVNSLLQLLKAGGLLPNFEELNDEETYKRLTTLMELVRMIRDGDTTSFDEDAQRMYAQLDE